MIYRSILILLCMHAYAWSSAPSIVSLEGEVYYQHDLQLHPVALAEQDEIYRNGVLTAEQGSVIHLQLISGANIQLFGPGRYRMDWFGNASLACTIAHGGLIYKNPSPQIQKTNNISIPGGLISLVEAELYTKTYPQRGITMIKLLSGKISFSAEGHSSFSSLKIDPKDSLMITASGKHYIQPGMTMRQWPEDEPPPAPVRTVEVPDEQPRPRTIKTDTTELSTNQLLIRKEINHIKERFREIDQSLSDQINIIRNRNRLGQ